MENKNCTICERSISPMYTTTCSWDCKVQKTIREGGVIHQPNGLPIQSIKHDGSLWEHEHADHPDYKFPVEIEYTGEKPDLPEWDHSYCNETHALIYSDGFIAITLYECCYAMWNLSSHSWMGGQNTWYNEHWKLTVESIDKISEFCGKSEIK